MLILFFTAKLEVLILKLPTPKPHEKRGLRIRKTI